MASFDFFKAAGLKVEEVVALAESEVRRIDSPLFQTLEQEMAELLGATVKKSASDAMVKKKRRVYIPYTVDQVKLYQLSTDYPEWEVVFTMADKCSAPLARTVFMMSTEKLFDLSGSDRTAVVAYGCTLNPLITRNRKWAHVCMPLADSASYRDAMLDDRVMQFIISAADRNGKTVPLAEQYKSKNLGKMCCSRPADCEFSAKIGVMMLNRTPTSFRQVCAFMRQHNTDALYFAVPWNKAMETGIDGPFPELDAHVFHSTEHIDIAFKNAQDLDVRFTRSSYLELITKTVFSIGDRTYMKEHVDYVNGMAFYRIIAIERRFDEPPPVYRSWLSPAYRDYYSVKAFVPKNEYVDLRKHTAYRELLFDVPKKLLDDLLTFGMSLDAKDNTPIAYRRKLRSLTSGILLHSTIVRPNYELSVAEFKALAAVAFTHVFMRRFVTGETVKQLLASVKRGFDLRHAGAVRVFIASVCRLAFIAHEYTIDAFLTRLNEYWRAIWQRNVPVGSFNQTVGFKEYVPEKTNPWITTNFQSVFELMKPTGFNPHLPGASHLSFLYSQRVVAMPPTFTPILSAADQTRLEADLADAMGIWDESTAVMTTQTVSSRPNTQSDVVESLTSSIVRDFGMHREAGDHTLKSVIPLYQRHPPEIVHAGISDSPIYDLQYVLEHIFPGTTIINTDQFQGDINYGPMKLLARAYKLSVDISKLQPLRPEKIYRPKVGAHTMPNTKTTLQNTLYTVVKRNLNTPDAKDPAGVEQVWNQVWPAVCRVFFVDGAEQMLESMPYIGPTYENVKEWVSNIPDDKRLRLLEEDFSKDELDMIHNAMILKSKGKPLLSQEYGEASKPAASIAYDPTGKRVAVYSPLIGQKVKRQTAVLKPNVLIMQRKSPEQISEFLCRFDHRPDSAGRVRRYIEFDGSMFDKSQGLMAKSMHWNMLSKFRILPELLDMLRAAGSALEASAIQAGVRVVTPPERETGAADTLDANCDVSLAIYARFLDSIAHAIEFIMVMGDDVTIAIRGDVDLSAIESDVARIFNIVVKYTLSDYGYFCSGWICHLNDGLSRWVPDPIKRILDYCGQSNNENTDIHDQFQSHHDLCRGIEDVVVQEFLSLACPARYAHVSDKITGIVVKMACRLIATVKDDEGKFSNFRSSVLTKRNL